MARAWWSSAVLLILGLGAGDLALGLAGLFARGFAGDLAAGFAGLLAAGFLAARAGLLALGLAGLLAAGFLGGILSALAVTAAATEFHAVFSLASGCLVVIEPYESALRVGRCFIAPFANETAKLAAKLAHTRHTRKRRIAIAGLKRDFQHA